MLAAVYPRHYIDVSDGLPRHYSNTINRTCRATLYKCSVETYACACFIGLQEETAHNAGNEKCSLDQYRPVKVLGKRGYGNVTLVKRIVLVARHLCHEGCT
jgi:hypothetical protein